MRTPLLARLLSLSTSLLIACVAGGYPGDEAEDTEVTDDGKGDAWSMDTPQGTYSTESAGAGKLVKLTLNADKSFRRELAACSSCATTVQTGKYQFTQGGGNRYIRFLRSSGTLIDRYGYEIHGRQLRLRKIDTDDWQPLMAEDNFGGVQSPFAGTYTNYQPSLPTGSIFELKLHDTGRFHMAIEAVHACNAAGHTCGSSFGDGFTGTTYVYGTWADRSGGVALTPRNDVTNAEASKINLAITIQDARAEITGKDGTLDLAATMDVRALFSGPHTVQPAALTGTWRVAKVGSHADSTVSLWGFALVLNGSKHEIKFDAETSEMCELSPNVNNTPKCGIYQIAHDPAGSTRGVLYAYRGTEHTALVIKSQSTTTVKLASDDGTLFTLTRE